MDEKELDELISYNQEQRHIEYKRSETWETLKFKIIKTCMAMSNKEGGGYIIIGVNQNKKEKRFEPIGMDEKHYYSYENDDIQDKVNKYADPSINLDVIHIEKNDSKKFVIIRVYEFEQLPTICRNDSGDELKAGEVYARSYKKIETSIVKTQNEMREIIDMAVNKQLRNFIKRVEVYTTELKSEDLIKDSAIKFANEAGDF